MTNYQEFLNLRRHQREGGAITQPWLPDWLFDFQRELVAWALWRGTAALFSDCGLGKTPMQLVWAENIVRHTNKRVLILTPLAVSYQTQEEAHKFQIPAVRVHDGAIVSGINITNYEQLHHYDPKDFVGVVADESSILKSFDGHRRKQITEFFRKMPYRLLATATAAPNDYIELGTSSEALGELGYVDVLKQFFVNSSNTYSRGGGGGLWTRNEQWRLKHHAEVPFWRWVASWARAVRRPSDMGFEDGAFVLPPLRERQHLVKAPVAPGLLFAMPARGLDEQRDERRRTIQQRCEHVASLVDHTRPALVWCHLNVESERLARLIPGAVEVTGSQPDELKEERLLAFAHREARVLVTKPKIGAWGLNFQHCAHVTFFPSHSFEQYYQGVRRCWRFGQERPVDVDIVTTEAESEVMANLQRKAVACDEMFEHLVREMHMALSLRRTTDSFTVEVPQWLSTSPTAMPSTAAIA